MRYLYTVCLFANGISFSVGLIRHDLGLCLMTMTAAIFIGYQLNKDNENEKK